jgi:predicted porin
LALKYLTYGIKILYNSLHDNTSFKLKEVNMKKLLVALLISAGFGSAQAQSNVTVYGILDVGYIGSTSDANSSGNAITTTSNRFGNGAESTSRIGFRGNEDLGGGTSAIFTVETGLTPSQGQVSTWINRQSFVGLKQNGLGQVTIGTQYTPVHIAVGRTDPGQQNQMTGNVIYSTGAASTTSGSGTDTAYTVRTANTIVAKSDKFAGFSGTAMYTMSNTDATQTSTTGGNTNYSGWGLSADYTWNKLYATVAYQSLKSDNTFTTSTPTYWTMSTTTGGGVNSVDNQTYAGLTYDFGVVKAYAQYVSREVTSTLDSSNYLKRTAQQIGVRGNFTSTIEGWASVGNGKYNAFGTSSPSIDFVGFQLGTNYWLSKRTNLYAIYGQTKSESANVAGQAPALSASNYAVGMRHTF